MASQASTPVVVQTHGRFLNGKARRDPERGYQNFGRVRQSADLAGLKPAVLKVRLLPRPPINARTYGLVAEPVYASGSEPDPKGWRFESSQAHQILRVEGEVILLGS